MVLMLNIVGWSMVFGWVLFVAIDVITNKRIDLLKQRIEQLEKK